MVYPELLPLMRTPRLPVVDWTDAPADLNGLVRFAEIWFLRVRNHISNAVYTVQGVGILEGDSCDLRHAMGPILSHIKLYWKQSSVVGHDSLSLSTKSHNTSPA